MSTYCFFLVILTLLSARFLFTVSARALIVAGVAVCLSISVAVNVFSVGAVAFAALAAVNVFSVAVVCVAGDDAPQNVIQWRLIFLCVAMNCFVVNDDAMWLLDMMGQNIDDAEIIL